MENTARQLGMQGGALNVNMQGMSNTSQQNSQNLHSNASSHTGAAN